jgi:AcrR family transcriptional regulator
MQKGHETKQAILDQAITIASSVGLEQLTIGQLASAVGLSKSGLFAHFRSKEQLQIEVLEETSRRFTEAVILPALRKPRGEPRMRAMVENWLDWHDSQPGGCVIQGAVAEMDDRPGPVRDYLVHNQQQWLNALTRAAEIGVEEGHFRKDLDLEQWAYEVLSLGLGYQHFAGLMEKPRARERVRRSFDALIDRSRP